MGKEVILGGILPNRKVVGGLGIVKAKGEPGENLTWDSLSTSEKAELVGLVIQRLGDELPSFISSLLPNLSSVAVSGSYNDLSDKPASLPASDVPEWAKQSDPPVVTKANVGLGSVTDDQQVKRAEMGAANGVATLDQGGELPISQAPSDLTFFLGVNLANTMASMQISKRNIHVSASGATVWSFASQPALGREFHVILKNTSGSDFTQPVPNSGNWIAPEATVSVKAGSFVELNCLFSGSSLLDAKYIVKIGEP